MRSIIFICTRIYAIHRCIRFSTPSRFHERRIVPACTCSRAARIIHDAPSYAFARSSLFLSLLLRLVCEPPPPPLPPSFPPPSPPLPTPPLSTVPRKLSLTLVDRVHGAHRSDGSSDSLLERNSSTITERTARGTGARNAIGRTDSSTRPSSPFLVTNISDDESHNN